MLWSGAQDAMAGRITAGALSQFVLYAVLAASALGELSQVWNEVNAAAGAAGRIAELLAVEPEIRAPKNPVALAQNLAQRLRDNTGGDIGADRAHVRGNPDASKPHV